MVYDVLIIGGGIVGLATGMQLKKSSPELNVLLLEKEDTIAQHQSGRNSGVIHSGIYYKPGSLKAENCFRGYRQLLQFLDMEGIPHDMCGKVIVATSESEVPAMDKIYERGLENGLEGLQKLDEKEARAIEPHANIHQAIYVPQTGIVDFSIVSDKYAETFQRAGGEIRTGEKVLQMIPKPNEVITYTKDGSYISKVAITCGGLYADTIARMTNPDLSIQIIPFRGEYHLLKPDKHYLVNNLIYPVPDPAFPFLGVHLTRMMHGGIEAGPSAVLAFRREGYSLGQFKAGELMETFSFKGFRRFMRKHMRTGVGEIARSFSKKAFVTQVQKLIPEVKMSDFKGRRAGVRAMALDSEGNMIDDFYFVENERIIHTLNAPSPAATASMSIGDKLAGMALKKLLTT